MDLHTGQPLWRAINPPGLSFPALAGDLQCEVAVIGGGVTGALVGYRLAREGIDAVLVDRGQPGEGSTAASTGLLQYEIDTPLAELIGKVGRDKAVHAYRRGVRAIDEIEELTRELGDSCGFSRRESLYFASHWCDRAGLKREFASRREIGLPVKWLARRELADISSIRAAGAILSAEDGQIDPYRFTQKLLAAASANGLRIFGDSHVASTAESDDGVVVQTSQGRLAARSLVVATGYVAHELLAAAPGNLQSTYVVASQPVSETAGWPNGCLLWETARPYFYARQTHDHRLLIGGGDTAFAEDHERDGLVEKKTAALIARFNKLFPTIPFIADYAWAGTFAETKDGLAYIGLPPGKSRTYYALGYGGNGITFSAIAAPLLVDLICDRPNPDAAVFSFGR